MTLDQLRIFLEVARVEHVTRASGRLGLTQSTISAAIRALEDRHGVELFERRGRNIHLTEAGRLFLPEAEGVLAAARSAQQMLDDLSAGHRGKLLICSSQTIASQWLPARMVAFRRAHPKVTVELEVGNTEHCLAALRAGRCDLAFVEAELTEPDLEIRVVARDRLTLLVGAPHPWRASPPKEVAGLRETGWVLRETGSGTLSTFEAALARQGLSLGDLDVVMTLPTNEAICAALQDQPLASVLSLAVAEPYIAAGRLFELPFMLPERPFSCLSHPLRRKGKLVKSFETYLN